MSGCENDEDHGTGDYCEHCFTCHICLQEADYAPMTPPRGEPMPQTIEHLKANALRDQELILEYAADISKRKSTENDLRQKLAARNKWISVEDRLPEDAKPVIVDGGCGHYSHKYKKWFTNMERDHFGEYREIMWTVTYWMPLPEPPSES